MAPPTSRVYVETVAMNNTAGYEYAKCSCSVHNLVSSSRVFCVVVPGAMASLLTVDDVLRGVLGEDGDSDGDYDGYTSGEDGGGEEDRGDSSNGGNAAAVSHNTYISGGVPLT